MRDQLTAARGINIALGVWLFISAFIWPHSYAQFTNSWLVGVLCVVFAVVAMWAPPARYLNAALAVWLFISAWALPTRSPGTVWNNVIVAIAIFVVSLLPAPRRIDTTPTGAPRV
ncbi:MAG: SPW repeat protein [Polyangiaceae bacterium]|nr:SPW repeat protein [Polyangiaceae bacterium]